MEKQTTIIVVGGGFGGLVTLRQLIPHARANKNIRLVLVDKNSYSLYYPNLYEVATAEEEFSNITELEHSVAIPFKAILDPHIEYVQGVLEHVGFKSNSIKVSGQDMKYDYLVLGLGSVTDFFNIPGMAEHAMPIKGAIDALKVKNAFEFLVQAHRLDTTKKLLRVIVAGGGVTGVEFAGELVNLKNIAAWKHGYPADKIEIEIVEGANQLMPGMPASMSAAVLHRLRSLGVEVRLSSLITSATDHQIALNNGELVNYDLLIWTGGVKSAQVPFAEMPPTDRKGRCMVEKDFTLACAKNIFMIGDNACVMDKNNMPLPPTATQAIMHGEYVGQAIAARLAGAPVPQFNPQPSPFIIPVHGKWAIMRLPSGFTMAGFIPWVIKMIANARYFAKIMPLGAAVKLAWFDTELYSRND